MQEEVVRKRTMTGREEVIKLSDNSISSESDDESKQPLIKVAKFS